MKLGTQDLSKTIFESTPLNIQLSIWGFKSLPEKDLKHDKNLQVWVQTRPFAIKAFIATAISLVSRFQLP